MHFHPTAAYFCHGGILAQRALWISIFVKYGKIDKSSNSRGSFAGHVGRVVTRETIAVLRGRFHRSGLEELLRIVSMQCFLTPAAYLLPRGWALFFADALSLSLLLLPTLGPKTYRDNRRAYGRSRLQSIKLTWAWLARPYRDLVVLKRITFGRENPETWRLVEKNTAGINALRASGKSYIIATAHFLRETLFSLSLPSRICGQPIHSSNFPPANPVSFKELRSHIQSWNLVRAVRAWDKKAELVFVGVDPLPFRTLYRRLCEPGNVLFIHIDAWAKKAPVGTFERPFAFVKNRVFATGAAQLARTARCPVISCIHSLQADGTILLEWGDPIHEVDSDVAVMNKLIDPMEVAVGLRPEQYPFRIGGERRWDPTKHTWEDLID